jgi:hypothetical protein
MMGHLVISHAAQDGYTVSAPVSSHWMRRLLRALFGRKN